VASLVARRLAGRVRVDGAATDLLATALTAAVRSPADLRVPTSSRSVPPPMRPTNRCREHGGEWEV
jgi:hypothetical protein